MLVCDHKEMHEDFKFLGNESDRCLLELNKSLFIKRDKPSQIRTYTRRSCFPYRIISYYLFLLQILFELYQLENIKIFCNCFYFTELMV